MNLADLNDLYRHMEWADANVWRALLVSEDASTDRLVNYSVNLVNPVDDL